MIHNIIYEIPIQNLADIANEIRKPLLEQQIVINPVLSDCIDVHLIRSGITRWLAQNIDGPYQMLTLINSKNSYLYDIPSNSGAKQWWKPTHRGYSGELLSDNVPVLFRFEDPGDAMLFKMTFIEK